MSVVYLIRHGRTAANEQHRYCGSTDLPLSEAGRTALKPLTLPEKDLVFLSSGMRRTDETMEKLFGAVPVTRVDAFREIDFGSFEMHTYEELKEDPAYIRWISGDNSRNVPPGGESGEQMNARVLAALPQLFERNTVLVTHGGVIAAIMAHLFPEEARNRYEWQPAPGGGYRLENGRYTVL